MTTPSELVKTIRQIDRQMEASRQEMARLHDHRKNAITELLDEVGGTEAARLLEITRSAVYRAAKR